MPCTRGVWRLGSDCRHRGRPTATTGRHRPHRWLQWLSAEPHCRHMCQNHTRRRRTNPRGRPTTVGRVQACFPHFAPPHKSTAPRCASTLLRCRNATSRNAWLSGECLRRTAGPWAQCCCEARLPLSVSRNVGIKPSSSTSPANVARSTSSGAGQLAGAQTSLSKRVSMMDPKNAGHRRRRTASHPPNVIPNVTLGAPWGATAAVSPGDERTAKTP